MNYKKSLLLFFFFILSQHIFADAMPKGYQKYQFNTRTKIDSVMIHESDDITFSTYDTLKSYHYLDIIPCNENECRYVGHRYKKYQRLVLFINNNSISLVYEPVGSNPSFVVTEETGVYKITETTGFLFRGKTGEILRALFITLLLELLTGLLMLMENISYKTLKYIVFANCISLPAAWLTFDFVIKYFNNSPFILILLLEVSIFIFEFAFLKHFLPKIPSRKIFFYSLRANIISFLFGGFLYLITTFI